MGLMARGDTSGGHSGLPGTFSPFRLFRHTSRTTPIRQRTKRSEMQTLSEGLRADVRNGAGSAR